MFQNKFGLICVREVHFASIWMISKHVVCRLNTLMLTYDSINRHILITLTLLSHYHVYRLQSFIHTLKEEWYGRQNVPYCKGQYTFCTCIRDVTYHYARMVRYVHCASVDSCGASCHEMQHDEYRCDNEDVPLLPIPSCLLHKLRTFIIHVCVAEVEIRNLDPGAFSSQNWARVLWASIQWYVCYSRVCVMK